MKKSTLLLLFLFLSLSGFSQITETFEGATAPTGSTWTLSSGDWAVFDNGVQSAPPTYWALNPTIFPAHTGSLAAYMDSKNIGSGNTSEDYFASPLVTVPSNAQLKFWARTTINGNDNTTYRVMFASPDLGGTQSNPLDYTTLAEFDETQLVTDPNGVINNYDVYTEHIIDLAGFAGQQIYIAFVMVNTQPDASASGDRWLLDDINLVSQCFNPTTLPTTVTATTATLNWAGSSPTYDIEVLPIANTQGTGTFYNGVTPPYLVNGLTPNTQYKYYVRSVCSVGNTSGWAGPFNFTTTIAPVGCGGNFADPGGATANYGNNANVSTLICPDLATDLVTVTFTSFNTQANTDILNVYAGNSATAPLIATYSGTTIPPAVTSASPGGCLFFVFTSNGNTTASGWIANITCAPAPACSKPINLVANTVLSTSAILTWTQPQNPNGTTASQWEVIAVPCSATIPAANNPLWTTATSPYTITGLSASTCYDFYARAICSATETSEPSIKATATTQMLPPACGGLFLDSGGSTANYANNENITTTICPTTPGDLVTVTFTAFNTEANWDALYVYNGMTATLPNQIASTNGAGNVPGGVTGGYWGTTIPGPFTSSSPDGCLTFRFRSDTSGVFAGWSANVTCAPAPTCSKPTGLTATAVLATSATLTWTQPQNPNGTTATQWEVIAVPCSTTAPAANNPLWTPATSPFILNGLSASTCYDFYVRAICSVTETSEPSIKTTATTQMLPPACGGLFLDSGGSTANYANNENITTTICPTTPGDLVTVTFTAFNTEANWDALYVYNGMTATLPNQIASTNGAGNVPGGVTGGYWGTTIPGPFTSSSPDGCLTFRFRSDSSGLFAGWSANVTCAPAPTCSKPTGLTATAVLATSATLTWTQPQNPNGTTATQWEVIAVPCSTTAPAANNPLWTPATSPFILNGLSASTCYDFYVRAICSATETSEHSVKATATTQIMPPACGGLFLDSGGPTANYANNENITTTICPTTPGDLVTVTFTAFNTEANWDALYVFDGNSIGAPQIASTNGAGNVPGGVTGGFWGTSIPGPFTSSSADGCLTFRFRSDTSGVFAGWSANVTCGPPPTCRKPNTQTATSITLTSAVLGWTQLPNPDNSVSTNWEVIVLPQGSPAPNAVSTGTPVIGTPSFSSTGLTSSTCYDFYVRSICSTSDSSTWTGPFNFCTLNPPPISTNTTTYTVNQLVEDILFNSTCASITNLTYSTGTNYGSANGIGYFDRNGSNFPFNDGVVMSTGNITNTQGPNTTVSSDGVDAWQGDTDLENIILAATGNPMDSHNASIIEFDFIPLVDTISFDFIFASEEYGGFQCTFSDAFAFLLTDNVTNITTNLAVVPNTTTPISVVTIRDDQYNNGCASVNSQYFADYYQLPLGLNPNASPTNFNGSTVPMTATSPVIPGHSYHIKLVVADRQDNILDSAVFLEGGSFNFGLELGIDFLISGGTALCPGTVNQLTSHLDPALYTFTWFENGNVITGQTGPNLLINHTGTYSLTAQLINTTCSATDTITVEYYDPIVLPTPNNMTACNASGFAQFNLSQNNSSVLGTLSSTIYTVRYYLTLADATAGVIANALPNLYTNTTQFLQTIYARVENSSGCFAVSQFNLIVQDLTPQFTITPNFAICNGSSGTIAITPTNFNLQDATYIWTLNGNPLAFTTSSINVGAAGTYAVTVNNSGCSANANTVLTVNTCDINIYASAVWVDDCTTVGDGKFYNTSGSGTDLINQDGSTFTSNYGVHVQNSGTLVLRGAEIKTLKSVASNVCNARMNYRVYQTGNTPPAFNPWELPFFSDCNTGTNTFDNGGGPCVFGQQKWQCVSQPGCTSPVDLTAMVPGNYTVEIYYDINGSFNTPNGCTDNYALNNGGSYYISHFTIQNAPTYTSTNPITCNGTDGTITIGNLIPNSVYNLTYLDDATTVGPTPFTANSNGQILISGLNAGTYSNFNLNINSCDTFSSTTLTLVNPPIVTFTLNSGSLNTQEVCLNTAISSIGYTTTNGVTGINATGLPTGVTGLFDVLTGAYTLSGTPTVAGIFNYSLETVGGCGLATLSGTITVNAIVTPTFNAINPICQGGVAPSLQSTSNNGIIGTWTPATINTATPGNTTYTFTSTSGTCIEPVSIVVTVNPLPFPVVSVTQPTCATPSGTIEVTAPLNSGSGSAIHSDLFISEVTDAETGSLTYIEIFNGTGTTKDLSNYKLKIYNNGNNFVSNNCDMPLSGILANNAVNVIKVSSNGNQGGVIANQIFSACAGVNTNDNIKLTTNSDVVIDNWGRTDGQDFTPTNQAGYTYRRLSSVTAPSLTWNPSDWTALDPEDYTNVGSYAPVIINQYLYSLDNGSYQTQTTFTNVAPGTHTITVQDTNTGCISFPLTVIIDPINANSTPTFDAVAPICSGGQLLALATTSLNNITGVWSPALNNTATTTYLFTPDANQCANTTTLTITVIPLTAMTLTSANDNQTVCLNDPIAAITYAAVDGATDVTVTGLPNGITGTYNAGTFTISGTPTQSGIFPYSVSTVGGCGVITLNGSITINPLTAMTLTSANDNQTLCLNDPIAAITYAAVDGATDVTVSGLPNGITGTYNAGTFTISGTSTQSGIFPYSVSTVGGCGVITLNGSITINPLTAMSLTSANDNQTVCLNDPIAAITYAAVDGATDVTVSGLPNGITGTYNAGTFTISGTSTQSGIFPYSVSTVGGCGVITLNGSITINPLTAMTLTSANDNQTVCLNDPIAAITYSAVDGATDVTVTGLPNGITGTYNAGTFTISGTSTQSGTFPYSVSTVGGCGVITLNGSITLTPLTELTLTSANDNQTVCLNDSIAAITYSTVDGANDVTVTGLPNGITGTYNAGTFTISGTSTQSGIFPYTITTLGGWGYCGFTTLNGSITINPLTAMTLTSANDNQTVCLNDPIAAITYSAVDGATDVTVSGLPNGITGTYNAGTFTISGTSTQSGTFPYSVSTVGGCGVITLNGSITINPLTAMTLTSANDNQTVCLNNPIAAITYSAVDGATDVTVTGLPNGITGTYNAGTFTISGTSTQSGTFPYSVSTVGGCGVITLNGSITINPLTAITLTSANDNQTVCLNDPIAAITYSAVDGATDVTVTGLPNGITGTYNAGTFTISGTSTQSGTFPYSVSTVGGCGVITLNGSITINPFATMSLTSANDTQVMCLNTAIDDITYSTVNATNVTVTGLPNGITGTYNAGTFTISGTSTLSGTFPYTVTTVGGCVAINLSGTITVNAKTIPTFNPISTICYGGTVPSLQNISVNSINGNWIPAIISNTTSGNYTFTPLTSECATPITIQITVEDSFDFEITGACMNNNFMLEVEPLNNSFDVNNVNISWEYNSLPVGTNSEMFDVVNYFNSTSVNEQLPATFYATVSTTAGCSVKHTFVVDNVICEIQRGISPNNDGDNEFFDLSQMDVSMLSIFNRYGTKVYSKGNYTKEWTGKDLKNNDLPDGTYYYVIEFNNNQEAKSGWIYINREKK